MSANVYGEGVEMGMEVQMPAYIPMQVCNKSASDKFYKINNILNDEKYFKKSVEPFSINGARSGNGKQDASLTFCQFPIRDKEIAKFSNFILI